MAAGGNGAAIVAVTKSDMNEFHGSVYESPRNSDRDSRDGRNPANLCRTRAVEWCGFSYGRRVAFQWRSQSPLPRIRRSTGQKLWKPSLADQSREYDHHAVNGKRYFAVMTGDGLLDAVLLAETPELKPPHGVNGIYASALP